MSNNNTSTSLPTTDYQSPLPLDDSDFANYLGLIRTNGSKKRQHEDDEESRSAKRRNKENIPLRTNAPADVSEPAVEKQHIIDSNTDEKKSLGPGIGKKRPNESDDEDEERRVKRRIAEEEEEEEEEETSDGAPELAWRRLEYDEEYIKTFGHKMTLPEACTERCTPNDEDREMFRKAKEEAEKLKTTVEEESEDEDRTAELDARKIKKVVFGDHTIDTWYAAPYPEEYTRNPKLNICDHCLSYLRTDYVAKRHKMKCSRNPPGDEIYKDGNISIFEVDGSQSREYCRNLCLLSKIFLDSKTLYYDVEPFLFYVLTEHDQDGYHFVGYFSKQKGTDNNVSCIMTLPVHQRKGYGQFLINFSYLLSQKEEKCGTLERPLSDLDQMSYRSYWKRKVFEHLVDQEENISIEEISAKSSMMPEDIIETLEYNDILVYDEQVEKYILELNMSVVSEYLEKHRKKGYITVDTDSLRWTPFMH